MNRAAREAVAAFELELEELVAGRAEQLLRHLVARLLSRLGLPPLEAMKRKRAIAHTMRRARRFSVGKIQPDDPFIKLAKAIVREAEPGRALARAIDADAFLEERGRSGANELLEEALEKIRKPASPPASFPAGSVVVIKKDGGGDLLARVLEVFESGMTRVRRVNRAGDPIGKRTWMLVGGEILRAADERRTARGNVRYELYPVTAEGGFPITDDGAVVLPPGLRNIA